MDYGIALDLTKYLANETGYIVWSRVSSSIAYVRDMMAADPEIYPKFQVILSVCYIEEIIKEIQLHLKSNILKILAWTDSQEEKKKPDSQTHNRLKNSTLGLQIYA